MAKKTIELKVAEAMQGDVGRGIVRLDTVTCEKLDVTTGDIIEITGDRTTAAKVWQAHSQDESRGIIRMDGLIRQNSGTSLGEKVKVRKANPKPAKKITMAPVQVKISFDETFAHYLKDRILLGMPMTSGDQFYTPTLKEQILFNVVSTSPGGIVQVVEETVIDVKPEPVSTAMTTQYIRYEDIGGLKEEISRVREMIELPMKHPELFEKLGIRPPKGVLLFGPPGTGKTLLAKAVASESNANFLHINGPEIMDKFYGESERRLREIFEEASQNAPSIIFIDEIDSIAPKRDETKGEVERRVVAQLLALMDGLVARGDVVVIAATNRPDSLDPALRRPGRFDREIEIGVPDRDGRKEVLLIHTRGMPLSEDVDLDKIANITYGFVGADLEAVSREAAMHALKRLLPKIDLNTDEIPQEVLANMQITKEDFDEALKMVEPSALREVLIQVPDTKWTDIGGLEEVKRDLMEAIEWPLKNPQAFKEMGIKAPKAVLMYGPPGCGKTLLAKAVANESDANFIAVKGPELLSKWVGESEKGVREIFKKARQTAPTIIFFDEIDAIAPARGMHSGSHVTETVVNQILTEMDGIEALQNVMILGATNRPDMVDRSLLRPGRFDKTVVVPRPDKNARLEIFKIHAKDMPLAKDVNLEELSTKTSGYTGADIEAVCREAALGVLRKDMKARKVSKKDFENALETIKPSVTDIEALQTEKNIKKDETERPGGYS
ncbi:MAG TPA: AAA family ATPase [Candidatus Altiarchaeales archaeon]|nr:AAA family ATPase [Candidatus Altiarchaeales archaeon]